MTILISEMMRQRLTTFDVFLKAPTVYRFLHQQELKDKQVAPPVDRRRFEVELPNDICQDDAMHGPMLLVDDKRRKTYLFAFIDDMSRLSVHAEGYLSEGLAHLPTGLAPGPAQTGAITQALPRQRPSPFRSHHLEEITASLGITMVHSPPYVPQGRGKLEKFFRTVRSQVFPGFKGNTLRDINEALECWIRDVYHQTIRGPSASDRQADYPPRPRPRSHRSPTGKSLPRHSQAAGPRRQLQGQARPPSAALGIQLHHGPHWRLPFLTKIRPGGQQRMKPNYRAFFALIREPFGSDLMPKEIMQTAEVLGVAKRFEYAIRLGALALVNGDVGSGKATALRWAASRRHPSE
ncbi:hypothetical protein DFAR_2910015 [Desulfarculales bacterium]